MNIADWIEKWAHTAPEKIALRFEGEEYTYPQMNAAIKANARMLRQQLGIKPGDRVAYLGQNHPQVLLLMFACARLGAIFVPLNWRLAAREHLRMLQDCGAAVLFVDDLYLEQSAGFPAELPDCRCVAVNSGQGGKKDGDGAWPCLRELLAASEEGADRYPDIGPENPLLIIYTSGTTGFPKGAVLTQDAVQTNAHNCVLLHEMTCRDVILTMLPLFHVGGLNIQTTTGFYAGACIILQRIFEPQKVLDTLANDGVTLTVILPAHMPALRALPGWEDAKLSLRAVLTGSSYIPDEMVRYWHGRGIPLLNMYGASETAPVAIHQSVSNAFATAGTIGFPAMHCEIRVVNVLGEDCPTDVPGEILVRGKNVMIRYWGNEKASCEALCEGGWFRTGDIGYVDAKGCYRIIDRKKDMIISGGENIYPTELENTLLDHPEIVEAAVVGRPDPRWGEVPVAIVVRREGSRLDKAGVLEWFVGRLGSYKHPKDVMFVDALPRNEMRKVLKHVLRDVATNPGAA